MSDPSAPPPAIPVPPFDAGRAAVFAVGIGVPIAAGVAIDAPVVALLAGIGAINALYADPRRGALARIVAIGVAISVLLAAAGLGRLLSGHHDAALAVAVALALPAGLVPMSFPYLSIVAKLVPLVVLVLATVTFPPGHVLGGYLGGTLFATAATLVEAAFRNTPPSADPLREVRLIWTGERNGWDYAIAYTLAVGVAMIAADAMSASRPFWAALAVLFVMHPDRGLAMQRIGQRIGGTFAAVAVAWVIVATTTSPWALAALATVFAALTPWALARGVFAGTTVATTFVLLLLDIGFVAQGGDRPLLVARLADTLIGTAAVAIATVALDRWRHRRQAADPSTAGSARRPPE